jgi:c-di-GMP-binding flagellar brake protein YcgR
VSDKRRHPRFTVEGVHGTVVFASEVELLNLSLGGVAIRADKRLNIGAEYTLKLEVGDSPVAVRGVVVWSVLSGTRASGAEAPSQYSAGLKFMGVLTDTLQVLMDFIDRNKVSEEHRLTGVRFQIGSGRALLDDTESYRVRLISLSGMLIETEHPMDVETRFPMELLPPGQESIHFTGRVASCQAAQGGGTHKIGIEFLQMSPDDRARLQRFVQSLAT